MATSEKMIGHYTEIQLARLHAQQGAALARQQYGGPAAAFAQQAQTSAAQLGAGGMPSLGQSGMIGAGGFGAPGVVGPGAQPYNPPQAPQRPRDKTLREELQSETDDWLKDTI